MKAKTSRDERGTIRDWIEFLLVWPLMQALAWFPEPAARRIAATIGVGLRWAVPGWRRVARTNLDIAFPELSEERKRELLVGCYRNIGRVLFALARLPRLNRENISRWIVYDGYEHFERASARGRGVLFLTAHLGSWELSSAAHALYGHPMRVMVRRLDNPLLDRFVDRRRTLFGNRSIVKEDAARRVLEALRRNEAVGILADQNTAGDDGVFVPFFGQPAASTEGVARFAARTGATIIPGFAVWNETRGRCVLKFYPPLEPAASGDRAEDVRETTRRCQAAIERAIREYPDQWLWIHRRWKRRPAGAAPIY